MARNRRPSAQTIAVLDALAQHPDDWSYGYDICRSIGLKAGTVYPILMRLADQGHMETTWETDPPAGRPARHLYRLSAQGVELVASMPRREWRTTGGVGANPVESTS